MEKLYDSIFIVDISQNPDEVETVTSRIQQLIEDHGGIIQKIDRWGKRRLAYKIDNKSHGFWVEIEFSASSRLNIAKTLEDEFRLNDRVLRYLTYIVSKKELIEREKSARKVKAEQPSEETAPDKKTSFQTEKEKQPQEQEQEAAPFWSSAEEGVESSEEKSQEKKEESEGDKE